MFVNFGRLVHGINITEGQKKEKPFQSLQFLIRDWQNPQVHPFGGAGGAAYLKQTMAIAAERPQELNNLRLDILDCFENVDCFLMPHPGMDVAENDSGTYAGTVGGIRLEFRKQLKEFVPSLLSNANLRPKCICGAEVTGQELYDYIKTYVSIFGSKDMPAVSSVFDATAKVNLEHIKQKALVVYQSAMRKKDEGAYEEETCFQNYHLKARSAAIVLFQSTPRLHHAIFEAEFQQLLDDEIASDFTMWAQRNRDKQLFKSMRSPIVLGVVGIVCHILCTVLGLIGLSSFASLLSMLTWICLVAGLFWTYSQFSGLYPHVVVQIDTSCHFIFTTSQEMYISYLRHRGILPALHTKSD